ncbi:MAG TPA: DEAD/DEAH box helicase, partial [Planctomycetaceae bacterium]|nr:DEAD/DEAH box helicase [Planctomycetaceae bacterium]
MFTRYHAKLFAYELMQRCSMEKVERLSNALLDAQVVLNPHQVDATLFAFQSPPMRGAILADEVGLGKTIEAGIVLSQHWAERKRRILIILPANLRKQWSQELQEKFYLPSVILESAPFNKEIKAGNQNPFDSDKIVLCSYQFARNKSDYVQQIQWDLAVIDEAHRLRNVYQKSGVIAQDLRRTLGRTPTLLLTATPLQNSLKELFGLASFIDEHIFGDIKSFQRQFGSSPSAAQLEDLRERLMPICTRTLRKQVLEYIKYTERKPHTEKFTPTKAEDTLYYQISEYLRRPDLQALPSGQRQLITMVLRKQLASSTCAIAGSLENIANRLQKKLDPMPSVSTEWDDELEDDIDGIDELADEFEGEFDTEVDDDSEQLSDEQRRLIENEIKELREFHQTAAGIKENAKGDALLKALKVGFAMTKENKAAEKAIIFTESKRTQRYLLELLGGNGYADDIVLFNGSNSEPEAKAIYADWKLRHQETDKITGSATADTRAALVEHFRDKARIMIATEAAAEGINLQFCSMVVNYDLPWNPQRIEQRIGRCHRYGQEHDVVVVNFLNENNAADRRAFQLLEQKFKLFDGVFGSSDESRPTRE